MGLANKLGNNSNESQESKQKQRNQEKNLIFESLPNQSEFAQLSGSQMLDVIFQVCDQKTVSDIQIRTNLPIYIETGGGMEPLLPFGLLTKSSVQKIFNTLLKSQTTEDGKNQISEDEQKFEKGKVLDFATNAMQYGNTNNLNEEDKTIKLSGRLRIQAHLSETGLGMTCRILSDSIPAINTLGIDTKTVAALKSAIQKRAGLILITGATGSGKSTTLAALIDWLRKSKSKHIVTIEDPIEYKYNPYIYNEDTNKIIGMQPSIITQQEVGRDIQSYKQGLKDVLRKAPHIILLGEVRDEETMEICIEAAQTGHLVISTLHTTGAVKTIGRILEMFPEAKRDGVVKRLAEQLICIHSQGLIKNMKGTKTLNYEFLNNDNTTVTSAIYTHITKPVALQECMTQGNNIEWDIKLTEFLNKKLISKEEFENAKLRRK